MLFVAKSQLSERLNLPLSPELVREIDEWRRRQDDIPARATAARRLIQIALKAEAAPDPASKLKR
jgi:hypothetical protein